MSVHTELALLVLLAIAFGMFLGAIATVVAAVVLDSLSKKRGDS